MPSATTTGPFSTTQVGFDAIKGSLCPKAFDTWRAMSYNDGRFNGVDWGYPVNFHNRLPRRRADRASSVAPRRTSARNVGRIRGCGRYRWAGFSLFRIRTATPTRPSERCPNVPVCCWRRSRQTVVDSPATAARRAELRSGPLFGRIGVNYMSSAILPIPTTSQMVPRPVDATSVIGNRRIEAAQRQTTCSTSSTRRRSVCAVSASGDRQTLLVEPAAFFLNAWRRPDPEATPV